MLGVRRTVQWCLQMLFNNMPELSPEAKKSVLRTSGGTSTALRQVCKVATTRKKTYYLMSFDFLGFILISGCFGTWTLGSSCFMMLGSFLLFIVRSVIIPLNAIFKFLVTF